MTMVEARPSFRAGLPPAARIPAATVRRRRVILGLTALTAAAALGALGTGSAPAWGVLAVMVVTLSAYGALLHRSLRLAAERDFQVLGDPGTRFFEELADLAVTIESGSGPDAPVTLDPVPLDAVPAWRQALALSRFVASCVAGWALAPIVFALTVAVGRTPRDTTGQRWLANLEVAQQRLKDQSMRTLVVSAATTASVTGVGTLAVLGGAGVAAAAPVVSSAVPAAASAVPASALPASAGGVYRVAPGDTLSSIAARYGTTFVALAAANHIVDPNLIYAGQVLSVPAGGSTGTNAGAGQSTGSYTVRAGDTLSSIAARFGTNFQSLASINGIADPNLIEVGEVLRLSGAGGGSGTAGSGGAALASAPITPAAPAATAPAATPASGAAEAVAVARAQVGKPYEWAGAGPGAFDCSGLVKYAWAAAGVSLPHYTVSQYQETTRISRSGLEPGDLVFYDTGDGAEPGHVTIYIGGGQVITADSPGTFVKAVPVDWDGTPMGYGRVG